MINKHQSNYSAPYIKDRKQDLLDMRCCIDRMIEMMEEDKI